MKIPEGIEGDYLETKEDHLIFDIKGLVHPDDRKICFIRFYPNENGDRMRDGRRYKKIYDLRERFSFIKQHYPQYLYYSSQWDTEVQAVKSNDIKKIYTPRDHLLRLKQKPKELLTRMGKISLELCDLFIMDGGVPPDQIGITGSPMVSLNKGISDIDLIIYGTDAGRVFQQGICDIFESGGYCRKYNDQEMFTHYEWRAGGSDIAFDDFLRYETRKQHQGMYRGFEFFIRYIPSPEDWPSSYYDFQYKNCGRIQIIAEVTDDSMAIFTPCSYKVDNVKIKMDNMIDCNDFKPSLLREISSYRGRFIEQVRSGEKVLCEGKLEKVIYKENETYFRILLQDQTKDKLLIM